MPRSVSALLMAVMVPWGLNNPAVKALTGVMDMIWGSVALAGKGRAESVVGVDLRLPGCRTAVPLA